ncbi:MAG TPA: PilW family protein, partial [Thiolinea sp.]|nr:PilW family protein [Thiolinea sp.]
VDQYWTATEVTNNNAWDKVALVQVAMLVRTVEPVFKQPDTQTYQLFEQQITTTDRYKHAVYTTTIYLRNIAR